MDARQACRGGGVTCARQLLELAASIKLPAMKIWKLVL
jgi:hypothetical protein